MKLEVKESVLIHNINLSLDQCYHKMRFLFCFGFLEEGPLNNAGLHYSAGDQRYYSSPHPWGLPGTHFCHDPWLQPSPSLETRALTVLQSGQNLDHELPASKALGMNPHSALCSGLLTQLLAACLCSWSGRS